MSLLYLTDDSGRTTAVVVPVKKWERIKEKVRHARQQAKVKRHLTDAFDQIGRLRSGNQKITLEMLLNDL